MERIRLFESGTHRPAGRNPVTYSDADIRSIYVATLQRSPEEIPLVLGHNDYPILGHLKREDLKIWMDDGKQAIGFDKQNANFSKESMDYLRKIGSNKISIRLEDGVMKHIGFVRKAAVENNNNQDFSAGENFTGNFSAVDDFEENETILQKIENLFKLNLNPTNMNQGTQDFSTQIVENQKAIVDLTTKNSQQSAEIEKLKTELAASKKRVEDFEASSKKQSVDASIQALDTKLKEGKFSEDEAKKHRDFGKSLAETNQKLFENWLEALMPQQQKKEVKNGSVIEFEGNETEQTKEDKARLELKKQYEGFKK